MQEGNGQLKKNLLKEGEGSEIQGTQGEVTLRCCGDTKDISKTKGERYGSGGGQGSQLSKVKLGYLNGLISSILPMKEQKIFRRKRRA